MSGRNKSKAKIHMSKPDLPPFLQRMKEQIVANEDAERKEQNQRKRKDGPGVIRPGRPDDPDDDFTVVKIGDDDLTEEEYKRMKLELETQYKLDNEKRTESNLIELDVDDLIQNRCANNDLRPNVPQSKTKPQEGGSSRAPTKVASKEVGNNNKKLSYSSSSEDDD